jgi:1,4-alpha-glucan branching enzyme
MRTNVQVEKKKFENPLVKLLTNKTSEENSGIRKQYLKGNKICRTTFRLSKVAAQGADKVSLLGDFNNWEANSHTMKKLKNGDFTMQIELQAGREYLFRYFIDDKRWENDPNADKYIKSPFGDCDNSVVIV